MNVWSHEAGPQDAPLIALIHGAMDRSAGMLKLSRKLDTDHRVLRYDRRGYGRSKPHPGPFTMEHQVADLVEVLAGRPAILFGHSYGGNVALATAERCPELVRAVAVYEVPLSWLEWWPGMTSRSLVAASAGAGAGADESGDAAERFICRMVGNRRWDSLPQRVQEERRAEGGAFVAELTDLGLNEPWHSHAIGAPVVTLCGEHGREHHRDGSRYLAELLSDRPAIMVAGAGHNGPFTHPDEIADAIRALASRAPT